MALTDIALRNAKPMGKPYKLTDEKGLYLLVTPSSGRLMKLKFRNKVGAEKKLSLGAYPEVNLKQMRERRDEARRMLSNGVDPAEHKRVDKHTAKISATNTFDLVANSCCEKMKIKEIEKAHYCYNFG